MVSAKNGSKDSCETFYFAGANTYYLVSVLGFDFYHMFNDRVMAQMQR